MTVNPGQGPQGVRPFAPPFAISPVSVESSEALAERCDPWRRQAELGIDTEFMRDRTFYPKLGLIQIGDGDECALVDPLAIEDPAPLRELFVDPGVTKIFHSCGEDLETLYHRFGEMPRPLFDTQIAASLVGLGASLGYGSLVQRLSGIELPKGETRSNWLQRPLTRSQKVYAALDVAYLPPLYEYLSAELDRLGRRSWHDEELHSLLDVDRFLPDPETLYRKIAHPGMSGRDLAVLRELCLWRETQARQRDLPRNFVIPKAALLDLVRQKPQGWRQLERISSLKPPAVKRHGHALLGVIKHALGLPGAELPERLPRPIDLSPHRALVKELRQRVAHRAEELGIPPELLANKRTVERMVRHKLQNRALADDTGFVGWRLELLEPLVDGLTPG